MLIPLQAYSGMGTGLEWKRQKMVIMKMLEVESELEQWCFAAGTNSGK